MRNCSSEKILTICVSAHQRPRRKIFMFSRSNLVQKVEYMIMQLLRQVTTLNWCNMERLTMKTDCKYVLVWFLQIYKILKKSIFNVKQEKNAIDYVRPGLITLVCTCILLIALQHLVCNLRFCFSNQENDKQQKNNNKKKNAERSVTKSPTRLQPLHGMKAIQSHNLKYSVKSPNISSLFLLPAFFKKKKKNSQ